MKEKQVRLAVRVQPGASKNEVVDFQDSVLRIRVTARPEKGKANDAVISYLSETTGIPKSRISIVRGMTSRKKLVSIEGLDTEKLPEIVKSLIENKKRS